MVELNFTNLKSLHPIILNLQIDHKGMETG